MLLYEMGSQVLCHGIKRSRGTAKLRGHSHMTSTKFCIGMRMVADMWFKEISRQTKSNSQAKSRREFRDTGARENYLPCICGIFSARSSIADLGLAFWSCSGDLFLIFSKCVMFWSMLTSL